ncbi:MAG: SRPBCC domain-containing protein [Opitutaceae bacterium]|nr:SRPBCC domain-containing protein [Verrucomicrobiales bacterium]
MLAQTDSRELISSRLIAASPGRVFEAYADPARLARWWGPNGFTNAFHEFDFRPDGNWRYDMRGPDGTIYPNESVFERVTPERVVLRHLEPVHGFTMTMTLAAENGSTRLTWRMVFDSAAECEKVRAYVPRCNEENFDRLEAELAGMSPEPVDARELMLTRLIDAPREKVYKAWTDPELITRWFTPPPYLTVFAQMDVRPGGASFIIMRGPDGTEMPNPGIYLEVVENERLVITDAYTQAWLPSEKPFMTVILTFDDEDGKTRYTARVRHWTVADREAHEQMGFHQGWGIATDQLAALASQL